MQQEKKYIFDDPKNIKRVLHILYICCGLLVILDFVIHRHTIHPWENLWAFYPIYGFLGCVILVFIAAWMRTFLMRDENYYENHAANNANLSSVQQDTLAKANTENSGGQHVDD